MTETARLGVELLDVCQIKHNPVLLSIASVVAKNVEYPFDYESGPKSRLPVKIDQSDRIMFYPIMISCIFIFILIICITFLSYRIIRSPENMADEARL